MNYAANHSGILLPPFQPGTVKPEADYLEFQRLGAKLGLPCPQAHICLESRDSAGQLHDRYADRSRTLNRNYWNWLFKQYALFQGADALASDVTFGAGHLTNKLTSGTVTNTNNTTPTQTFPLIRSAALTDVMSVVVGTGTAAESFDGFALNTQILHGSTAGKLAHNTMVIVAPSYNAGTLTWTATQSRIFNNNSGGTIVVAETGVYAMYSSSSFLYLLMRDLLGATVSVLNGGQLTVTYTFTLTFPA